MANRAYLYTSATVEPHVWEELFQEPYYDSRHGIPLAWFFFFRAEDIRMVDVKSHGDEWQEVKFAAIKAGALDVFNLRLPLLREVTGRYSHASDIERLLNDVSRWPGHYLLMNPVEVVEDDESDAQGFREIIAAIDATPGNPNAILEAASFCIGDINDGDELRRILNIVGATYWD